MNRNGKMQIVGAMVASSMFGSAAFATVGVIYSEIPTSATSQVPGLAKGTLFISTDRPFRSPDSMAWIFGADTTVGEVIIVGTGTSGSVVAMEGADVLGTGELLGTFDTNLGFNNSGEFAFATNTDAATTSDEVIVKFDGTDFNVIAREGDMVPGTMADAAAYGTGIDLGSMSNDGHVSVRASLTVGTLDSDFDDFLLFVNGSSSIVAQEGTTIPGNQAGAAMDAWDTFDFGDFYISADGMRYLAQGDTTAATTTDDVVVVDDDVVIQEDQIIAGSGFASPVSTIGESLLMTNGDWLVRGSNDDGQDWVVYNGDVVAASGDTITSRSAETFSDIIFSSTFFLMHANDCGDVVIGGTTDAIDEEADAVIVVNDRVLLRQGDPVDLDGNGMDDDNVFLDIFNNDDAFLTNDGWYYFTADVYDDMQAALGQAFMRVRAFLPGDIDRDGDVDQSDLGALLSAFNVGPGGDVDCDGDTDQADLGALLANFGNEL